MTYFMAYVILASAGIAACAVVAELVLRPRSVGARWAWLSALGAIVVVTVVATFVPSPVIEEVAVAPNRALSIDGFTASPITVETTRVTRSAVLLKAADSILPGAWLLSSVLLVAAILYGQRRLRVERAVSKRASVNGRVVLLTENVGPAVAGVGEPVVLLPRWVLALNAESRDLLLAHEFEHIRRGDTRLLLAGAVTAALMPWNPIVWWVTRRLRLAVEQDCDARVLKAYPDVRRYADLLLIAASQAPASTRLLAAHFGEHRSDLDRRIHAMTERKPKWKKTLAATAFAATLVSVSCEAPRPAPLAPAGGDAVAPQVVVPGDVLDESQVEKPVKMASASAMPRYPEILRQAGVEGDVLVAFVVNEDGTADVESFKVIRSTHELFATAVKLALSSMRFVAAEVGGKRVKQLVQQPFTFTLPGVEPKAGSQREVAVREGKRLASIVDKDQSAGVWEEKKSPPRILYRVENGTTEVVNFELLNSKGGVVSSYASDKLPTEIRADDIAAIEVIKPRSCAATNSSSCPLIRITLKEGREAAYRKR